jgi:outer membrane receptor for ferrienterochelin and colicins
VFKSFTVRARLAIGVAAAAMAIAAPAYAQPDSPTPAPPPAPDPNPSPSQSDEVVAPPDANPVDATATPASRRTYTPEDFARYAPRTALDMLQRVPGFTIQQAQVQRGLGQATGNVLLNGQRVSNQSDDIVTQIGRIPASNVVRIEIADAATLDIPGLSGQVANIIVRAASITGQFSYSPEFRANYADPLFTRFSLSVSGKRGPVEYTLGLENQASRSSAGGPTTIFNADRSIREARVDEWTGAFDQPRASARLVIDGPGSSVGNLNMIYREFWYDYVENGVRTRPGALPFDRDVHTQEDGHNYEIGGDFEFALGPGRLKLIGLQRYGHNMLDDEVIATFQDGRPQQGQFFVRDSGELERIARAEYRFAALGGDLQLSGEAAFNALDTSSLFGTLTGGGTPVLSPFPGSDARVEEARYEGILSYSRPLAEGLTIQVAAGAEFSQLSQIGAGGLTREFVRPKGNVNLAWSVDPNTSVNLRLQRRVGQISFFDFVDSIDLNNNTGNAGNINLVPPQSWEAEVEGVRRFGAYGQTTVRAYYHAIEDVIDVIPIGATGQGIGNIDSASRIGLDWRSTLNFDPFGWTGARLDFRVLLTNSEVEDPLTGEIRQISGITRRFFEGTFRWDIAGSDWAVGTAWSSVKNSFNYRLTEVGRQTEGPIFLNAYVEHKDVFGLTVRATLGNVADARSTWDRTVFVNRRDGPVDFYEQRDRLIGPIFSFQIRGRF